MEEDAPNTACNIFQGNAFRIMHKMDSQIPLYIKLNTDMYREYRRAMDHLFGACFAIEDSALGDMLNNTYALRVMSSTVDSWTKVALLQLDAYEKFLAWYVKVRIHGIKSFDEGMSAFMNMYRPDAEKTRSQSCAV